MKQIIIVMLLLATTLFATEEKLPELKPVKKCDQEFSLKKSFELGAVFGTPMGFDIKYFLTNDIAVKSVIGLTFEKDVTINLDLLVYHFNIMKKKSFNLQLVPGFGALVGGDGFYDDFKVAIGVPIALEMPFKNSPVTVTLLFRPGMELTPKQSFDLSWHLGLRYNFKRAKHFDNQKSCMVFNSGIQGENISSLANALGKTVSDLQSKEQELGVTQASLNSTKNELNSTQGKLSQTEGKLQNTTQNLEQTKTDLNKTNALLSDAQKEIAEKEEDLKKMETEMKQQEETLKATETKLTSLKQEKSELESDLKNAQSAGNSAEVQKLKDQLANINSETTQKRMEKCISSGGTFKNNRCNCGSSRVSKNDRCVCAQPREMWYAKKKTCICSKGFYKHKTKKKCVPCQYVKSNGYCRWNACGSSELKKKVGRKDGVNVYKCVARCTKANEIWLKTSKRCGCADGYKRIGSKCVSRN